MTNKYDQFPGGGPFLGLATMGTQANYPLDTNFAPAGGVIGSTGSTGKCVGMRFMAPVSDTIDYIMFFITTAPASQRNLSLDVCAYGAATTRAGASITNGHLDISGGTTANKWIKASYTNKPAVIGGTAYWVVIGDTAGAASGYSIATRGGGGYVPSTAVFGNFYTSADAFASAGTSIAVPVVALIKFTNGEVFGNVYTLNANDSSSDLERGFLITPDEDIVISGLVAASLDTGGKLRIYQSGQNPGGTIYSGFNGGAEISMSASATAMGCIRFAPTTLYGGQTYRIVQDPNGVAISPGYAQIEDYASFPTELAQLSYNTLYGMQHTEESAGPAWTESADKIPRMALMIRNMPVQAAGGIYMPSTRQIGV